MKGLVIDIYNSEAFIAMPDGMNICVGLSHLPPNTKTGSNVVVSLTSTAVVNPKLANEVI
jgi:hypothetical protein